MSSMKLAFVVVASAAVGSLVTYAAGVPNGSADDPPTPALVYSGVMIENGVPAQGAKEVEIALWDDPIRGMPDLLLCETPEGFTVTPDVSGAFSVPLPDLSGVADQDCVAAIRDHRKVWIQVKVGGVVVRWSDQTGAQTLDRLPLSNVPFALEAGRASAAALPSQLENRVRALESATPGDAGPEIID